MKSFHEHYTLAELKDIARKYKTAVGITFSGKTKKELADTLHAHLVHDAKDVIRIRRKEGEMGYHGAVNKAATEKQHKEMGERKEKEGKERKQRRGSEERERMKK